MNIPDVAVLPQPETRAAARVSNSTRSHTSIPLDLLGRCLDHGKASADALYLVVELASRDSRAWVPLWPPVADADNLASDAD